MGRAMGVTIQSDGCGRAKGLVRYVMNSVVGTHLTGETPSGPLLRVMDDGEPA